LDSYSGHVIEKAFAHVDASQTQSLEQMASLEFAFLELLAKPWERRDDAYGIPNLERYVARYPAFFVQLIALVFNRSESDPNETDLSDEQRKHRARRAYKLLDSLRQLPGRDSKDKLNGEDLLDWVKVVRKGCADFGCGYAGDICIGEYLAHAPIGDDKIWPCEPVRDVLESIGSVDVARGAHTAVYNSRGVHWRGAGGKEERELAARYRLWAEALRFTHPFVSERLLMSLVNTYEDEARREDLDAEIQLRLR
jgi:hypothetical protein